MVVEWWDAYMDSTRVVITAGANDYLKRLKQIFIQSGFVVVGESDNHAATLRLIQGRNPELIIVDKDSSDINIIDLIETVEADQLAALVVLTSYLQPELTEKAKESWFLSYIMKPVADPVLISSVEVALANFERFLKLEQEVEKLKNTLESRKIVEKAKGLLMKELDFTEDQAYKHIQKKSMDKCISMKKVAESIIIAYE